MAFTPGGPGDDYELADDCAPIAKYGGQGTAKGSYCAVIGGSRYCTHDCSRAAQCTDLGATATCEDGMCIK